VETDSEGLLDDSVTPVVGVVSDECVDSVAVTVPVVTPVGRPLRPSPTDEEGFGTPPEAPGPIVTPVGTNTPEVSVGAGSLVGPVPSVPEPESGAAIARDAPVPATSSPDAIRHAAAAMRTCGATPSPPLTASFVDLLAVLRLSHKPAHLFAGAPNRSIPQGAKPTDGVPGDSVDTPAQP
jgi:hypothetical protein